MVVGMREFTEARRIVIKVGTSTLAHATGRINIRRMEGLVKALADLQNGGRQVVLVSSGAIGVGVGKLGLPERPADMPSKQAAAAVGQCELMCFYDRAFSQYHHTVAQVLITAEDFESGERRENFGNTMRRLLDFGVLPVINENDTVATAEISVGDNDTLSALTAVNINADILVLLSDIDGLYSADPHVNKDAELISEVEEITPEIEKLAGGSVSGVGTGGMATKIHAAKLCVSAGCDMVIANGSAPELLYGIVAGKPVGTHFKGKKL